MSEKTKTATNFLKSITLTFNLVNLSVFLINETGYIKFNFHSKRKYQINILEYLHTLPKIPFLLSKFPISEPYCKCYPFKHYNIFIVENQRKCSNWRQKI